MVVQGGTDHARYRAVSGPAGIEVAVGCEPRNPRHQGAARGRVGRASGRRGVGVSALHQDAAAVRSRRGAWRHLDSCQFQTHLHARIPRVDCGEHGVVQITVPWAEPRSRFTLLFERLAIDVLRQCDVSGTTRILRISWDEAWGLMERAVTRGRQRKACTVVRRIGVDATAAAKGHRYLTVVCDLDEGTVEHLAEDRKQESLEGYYAGLTQDHLDGIEAVAMDMGEPYIQATLAKVPEAAEKIVVDRFHVMGHVGKAVDTRCASRSTAT